jgi:arylsulfatase A-like enzyme
MAADKKRNSRSVTRILFLALLLVIIAGAVRIFVRRQDGGGLSGISATSSTLPNIIVIIMDTVRQDRLSCYGYSRETSPNLERLSKTSRVYDNAYSTSGWTAPAHASLFTGLYPIAHGTTQKNWTMDKDLTTLAEILSAVGYKTFAVSENPWLSKLFHFDQGFSEYYETWRIRNESPEENLAFELFSRFVNQAEKGRPFFAFINFMAAHNPYNSSHQFFGHFTSDKSIYCTDNSWQGFFLGRRKFSPQEIQQLNEHYDEEILYVDYLVGRIADLLVEKQIWDETVFVVTSDHGENIGDHGLMDHVFSLYQTTIKIPLLIHYPGLFPADTRDEQFVQILDIFPTLLGIVGVDSERIRFQGLDITKSDPRAERAVICEYDYPQQVLSNYSKEERESEDLAKFKRRIKSIIFHGHKFIWADDGKYELYDLGRDPGETVNLIDAAESLEIKTDLQNKMDIFIKNYQTAGLRKESSKKIDEETKKALRSLGYVR